MKTARIIAGMLAAALFIAAHVAAAPPELTPDQAIQAREGDTWSSATFVRKEGRKYLVRYADGTEEWVTADRVRLNDSAGAEAAVPGPAAGSTAVTLDGPFTQVFLQPPQGVPRRVNAYLHVKPTTQPSAAFRDLTPPAGTSIDRPSQLIICPDNPDIVVAVGRENDGNTPLLAINVNDPAAAQERIFTTPSQTILGAAAGGQVLVSRANSGTMVLHLWEYHDDKYQLKANYTFIAAGKNAQPEWAWLLTPTRLLIRCDSSENYLIDLPGKRQMGAIKCDNLSVHCSGQFLLGRKDREGLLLRPTDLAIVGQVPDAVMMFGVDATGALAAAGNGHSINVVRVVSNEGVGHINGLPERGRIDVLGMSGVLIDGKTYYDLKTGLAVWGYNAPECESVQLANGQMLYVGPIDGKTAVIMTALPDSNAHDALKNVPSDQFLLRPGAHIAIVGDLNLYGNPSVARANIEHSLTGAGHKADDKATQYKLTFTSAAGPTGTFAVREFHMNTGPLVREVPAPSTVVTFVLTRDGDPIWKKEMTYSAKVVVTRRGDQTLEQAVAEAAKPNANSLKFLDIPGNITKASDSGKAVTLGESNLTHAGFVAPAPAPK